MKASSIYLDLARFCSGAWHFFRWFELEVLAILLGCLGWLFDKLSAFAGPRLPQYPDVWSWFWQTGHRLINLSSELVIVVACCYCVIWIVAKFCGVRLIRSNRLSKNLRQMISTAVDEVPRTDRDQRTKAKSVVAEQANKAVRRSFVIVRKNDALAVVKIPTRVETRKIISDDLSEVADDLSDSVGMTSSSWQMVKNGLTFASYEVMRFKS